MVDATQLWVTALGVVCVALALIVFYAVRKVLVLKEDIDKARQRLSSIEALQKETAELLKATIEPEVHRLKDEHKEVISRLSADIRDLNASQLSIHTKVNEQDLRVKSISSLVNQLSVQQQETLRMGLLSAETGGGMSNNGGGGGDGGAASPSRKAEGGGDVTNLSKMQHQLAEGGGANASNAGSSLGAELASILSTVFSNSHAANNGGNSSPSSGGGGGAIAMLSKALAADRSAHANLSLAGGGGGGAVGAASPLGRSSYSGGGGGFMAVPPITSTLAEILQRHGRVPSSSAAGQFVGMSRNGGGGGASFIAPPITTVPPAVVAYHATAAAPSSSFGGGLGMGGGGGGGGSGQLLYRKKTMRLQFSVGPSMSDTAISLSTVGNGGGGGDGMSSPLLGKSSGGGGGAANNSSSAVVRRRSVFGGGGGGPHDVASAASTTSSGGGPVVLLYLSDILALNMGFEPFPVDETDAICIQITLKRTERSTHNLLLSGGGGVGNTNKMSLSSPSSVYSPTTISAALGGASTSVVGGRFGGASSSSAGSVDVTLYAPMCPSVEEWVVFLHAHLGDKVVIRDDLL